MLIPFQLCGEIEIVSDNAASHRAVISEQLSEIPALSRYRTTGRPPRTLIRCRRRQRPRSIPVTFDLCSDRWKSTPAEGNKSLDCILSSPSEQYSVPKSQMNHGVYISSPTARALDHCPRMPHRSDSYSFGDDYDPVKLISVLGDALNINERLLQHGSSLSTEPSQVQVVARTG